MPQSLAELVLAHRTSLRMSRAAYARHVGTSRQNIDNVEAGEARQPRYLGKLAAAMGVTVDALMAGQAGPWSGDAAPAQPAQPEEPRTLTPGQWRAMALSDITAWCQGMDDDRLQIVHAMANTARFSVRAAAPVAVQPIAASPEPTRAPDPAPAQPPGAAPAGQHSSRRR